MSRPEYFFAQTSTGDGTGTSILKAVPKEAVTAITRSKGVFCPSLSTICINFAAGTTGSVNVVSNPFDDAAKDKILATLTASGEYVVPSASVIIVDVTAIAGTISARAVRNQEVE